MIKSHNKPLIGITLDYQKEGGYSDCPWYALRTNYAEAVTQAGGVPVMIPYDDQSISYYSFILDGLVLTGGNFDIDPAYYNENKTSAAVSVKEKRTSFEISLAKSILEKDKPILGICAGQQLLNVIFGGSLIQHIPDTIPDALQHEQPSPKHIPTHRIDIKQNTLLFRIIKTYSYMVNSTHHQAVNKLGKDIIVNATAPDGVIEGIEHTKHRFCLGVEWHPEYCYSEEDKKIFSAFIGACSKK